MNRICDICGWDKIGENDNFCGKCGVDLKEPIGSEYENQIEENPDNSPRTKKKSDKPTVFNWCLIYHSFSHNTIELPLFLQLLLMFGSGEADIGFCDCAACNQGYRELLAVFENLKGNKKIKSSSRMIVKKLREKDISKITLDLPNFVKGSREKRLTNQSAENPELPGEINNRPEIIVKIDSALIENSIVKVLKSKRGQELIKKAQD